MTDEISNVASLPREQQRRLAEAAGIGMNGLEAASRSPSDVSYHERGVGW
jgi:hypothetical protein